MPTPRDYQSADVAAVLAAHRTHRAVLGRAATGLGKAVELAMLAQHYAELGRVMVLVDVVKLVNQLAQTIGWWTGIAPGIEMADQRAVNPNEGMNGHDRIIVSTVQTQYSGDEGHERYRVFDPKEMSALLLDECLIGSTRVSLADGTVKTIESIAASGIPHRVKTFDTQSGRVRSQWATGVRRRQARNIWRIRLRNGGSIECTHDHPVYTKRGFVPASSLCATDSLLYYLHDRISTATGVGNTSGGRVYVHSNQQDDEDEAAETSAAPGAAVCGAGGVCDGETPLSWRAGGMQATRIEKWWVGIACRSVRDLHVCGVRRYLQDVLHRRQEAGKPRLAGPSNGRGAGVVVHGRWQPQFSSRSIHLDRGVWFGGESDYCPVVHRAVGHQGDRDEVEAGLVLCSVQQDGRAQAWATDRTPCHTRDALQAVCGQERSVLSLWSNVHSAQVEHSVLRRVSPVRVEGSRPSEIPAESQGDTGPKPPAGVSAPNYSLVFDLRKTVFDRTPQQSPVRQRRLQDQVASNPVARVVHEESPENPCWVEVEAIERTSRIEVVYDLRVETDHNFFANGALVHNCELFLAPRAMEVVRYYMDGNPELRVFGCSATPFRTDGVAMANLFDHCAFDRDIRWGVSNGWLVDGMQGFIRVDIDFSTLKVAKGEDGETDYSGEQLASLLSAEADLIKLAKSVFDVVGPRKTIVVCPRVAMAQALAHYLEAERPGCARCIYGELGDTVKDEIFEGHSRGEFQFLTSCAMLTKGYDDPSIGAVVNLRKTRSKRLYQQIIGRGVRPLSGILDGLVDSAARLSAIAASAKPKVLVVDLVGVDQSVKDISLVDILGEADEQIMERARKLAMDGAQPEEALEQARQEVQQSQEEAQLIAQASEEAADDFDCLRIIRGAVQVKHSSQVEYSEGLGLSGGAPSPTLYGTEPAAGVSMRVREGLRRFHYPDDVIDRMSPRRAGALLGTCYGRAKAGMVTSWKQVQFLRRMGATDEQIRAMKKSGVDEFLQSRR